MVSRSDSGRAYRARPFLLLAVLALFAAGCDPNSLSLGGLNGDPAGGNEEPADPGAGGDDDGSDGSDDGDDGSDDEEAPPSAPASRLAAIQLNGDAVENIRSDPATGITDCDQSELGSAAGQRNLERTCVDTSFGEVGAPVGVAMRNFPGTVEADTPFSIDVEVRDIRTGAPLDLNAFTEAEGGGAGDTYYSISNELGDDGFPLLHCHMGIVALDGPSGFPTDDKYSAAFLGLQQVGGQFQATISPGLPPGFYSVSVFCGGPGHMPLGTPQADDVQAHTAQQLEVVEGGAAEEVAEEEVVEEEVVEEEVVEEEVVEEEVVEEEVVEEEVVEEEVVDDGQADDQSDGDQSDGQDGDGQDGADPNNDGDPNT